MAEPSQEKEIEGAYVVPDGWVWCKQGEVCEINPKSTNLSDFDQSLPTTFVPMTAVDQIEGTIKTPEILPLGKARKGHTQFIENDVIFARITPCMENGKAAIAKNLENGLGFGSTEFHVIRPPDEILPEYIFYFIRQESFRNKASAYFTSTVGQMRVPKAFMLAASFPLPPLPEQHRIVAKLEALLAQVNRSKDHLAKVPLLIKRFRQSVLAAACSGRLTEDWRREHPDVEPASRRIEELRAGVGKIKTRRGVPMSVDTPEEITKIALPSTWTMKSAAALLRATALIDVKDGNHGANHPKKGEFSDEGLPFITAAQVRNYQIDYVGAQKVSEGVLKRLRVGFAEIDDAILTHKGTVGRAASNSKACVLSPQTTYYRCNRGVINPLYLVYFFTSPQFFLQLATVMSQTTRDFVPISEQVRLFLFVPPLPEQHEIVRRIENLFHFADEVGERVAKATVHTEHLTQSILARAFRGELVPQNHSDEPASVLLERIKQKRAKNEMEKKTGKRKTETLLDYC